MDFTMLILIIITSLPNLISVLYGVIFYYNILYRENANINKYE